VREACPETVWYWPGDGAPDGGFRYGRLARVDVGASGDAGRDGVEVQEGRDDVLLGAGGQLSYGLRLSRGGRSGRCARSEMAADGQARVVRAAAVRATDVLVSHQVGQGLR